MPTPSEYASLGLEFRRQHEIGHAYGQFTKSITLNPATASSSFVYYYRSQIYDPMDASSIRRAIKDIECAITIGGRKAENYCQLGQCLFDAQQYAPAIEALSESIGASPESQKAFLYRARAYCSVNKSELALADYLKSLELDPGSFEAHWELAELYEALGDHEAAAGHYVDKETFRPETAQGLLCFAESLWEESDHAIALECLADAAVLAPNDVRPPLLSALIRNDLGDYRQALSDAATVVSLAPFDPCGYRIRAQLSMVNMQYDGAVRDLTRAIELSVENSIDYDKRATAYSYAKDERASWQDAARANAIRKEEQRLGLVPDPLVL